jgi:hypothetical protein
MRGRAIGPEVLLDVPQDGVAQPLVMEHAAGDELASDAAVLVDPQEQADPGHGAALVDPHRDEVDIEDRQLLPSLIQVLTAQPGAVTIQFEGHEAIVPRVAHRWWIRAG